VDVLLREQDRQDFFELDDVELADLDGVLRSGRCDETGCNGKREIENRVCDAWI
jgi:hypothetical protein